MQVEKLAFLEDMTESEDAVASIAWSPEGSRCVSGDVDGAVKIWCVGGDDPHEWSLLRVLGEHAGLVQSVSWSPDGRVVASGGGDGVIKLWHVLGPDPDSWAFWRDLGTAGSGVCSLSFSPDSARLATGGCDRRVLLWSVGRHTEPLLKVVGDHLNQVLSVGWSPDGSRIISRDSERATSLWLVAGEDPNDWRLLKDMGRNSCKAPGQARLLDEMMVTSNGLDRHLRLWVLGGQQDAARWTALTGQPAMLKPPGGAPRSGINGIRSPRKSYASRTSVWSPMSTGGTRSSLLSPRAA